MPTKAPPARARARQWGAERRTQPLPTLHEKPSRRRITMSRLAIVLTIVLWATYIVATVLRRFLNDGAGQFRFTMETIGYVVVVTLLTFSALMYLVARQGALQRFKDHVRVPRAELDRHFAQYRPSITVLVPSYAEEPHVVRATLLSAALQEYPSIRVVLLLDDPPVARTEGDAERLEQTRRLADDINTLLAEPHYRLAEAFLRFELQRSQAPAVPQRSAVELVEQYAWAAGWLRDLAAKERVDDHIDIFFVEQVLGGLAAELELTASALEASIEEGATLSPDRVSELYRRLTWIFACDVAVFERKRYASLPHDANKAMNLNAYIGLMGGAYRTEQTPVGPILLAVASPRPGDLVIPDADFLLTLDADSILLRDYCVRLVHFLQQPSNSRVAVTQTPYSSFRGAATRIERLAAATTDIQHILHQGMSHYGATFWVGANAVIRKRALDEIMETETVGGFEVRRYIQDRTVIEDTESSLDIVNRGWSLVNYPERLSYSATPPDFGSLIVQRRRWANGGLLILPKFFTQIRERRRAGEPASLLEILLRLNYMASISWASFGLIFLLAYPYDGRLLSPIVLLTALPYFAAMASDLRSCGYRRSDVIRIYGFNLILLPVNLAGVLKSLQQAITGTKIPFARTPKVKNRTASPLLYVVAPLAIIAFSLFTLWRDVHAHNWGNAAFAGINALLASWAVLAFIGVWPTIVDIWRGLTAVLYVERPIRGAIAPTTAGVPVMDWRAVLYHGHAGAPVPAVVVASGRLEHVADSAETRTEETDTERVAAA